MGSKKSAVVGYRYSMSVHMGVSRGPLNGLRHVKVADKTAWIGNVGDNTVIPINQPALFGGDEKEGGVVGNLYVFFGAATQTFTSAFKALMGGLVPDFRGTMTLFWRGQIAVNNPYPKPWKFRVYRHTAGWDLDPSDPYRATVWYEDKCRIYMDGGIEAMNPAHMIYQCLTDRRWGRGLSPAHLDDESFTSAANKLCSEMFGLCLRWNRQSDINEFIDSILSHIGGVLYADPRTGKLVLKLIRADYDPDTLPVFTYTSGLLEIEEDETGGGDGSFSEVRVTYTNPEDGSEASVSVQSLALQQANGDVASTTAAYPGVPTAALALRLAQRDLELQTASKRFKLVLDRRGWKITPGMPFKISAPDRGVQEVIVRAGTIEDTELTDGRIIVMAVEDFFGLPASSFSEPETPGAWTPPDNSAIAADTRRLEETSYRDLAATLSDGDLAAVDADAGYYVVLAKRPSGTAISYDLGSAATGETMRIRGTGNWTPTETISGGLDYYDTVVTFGPDADLSAVEPDEAILVGDEMMRVDGIDTVTGSLYVARGCADTLPQQHPAGTRAWFYEDLTGTDGRDYATGETVEARVLTITPSERLDLGDVLGDTISIGGRQGRPYPAGDLRVNSVRFGEAADTVFPATVELTWSHRDRILQDDRLIEHEAVDIGPEAGTVYRVRVLDGSTLLREETVAGSSWLYDDTMISSDGEPVEPSWTFEHESERDGLVSWQKYVFPVPRRRSVSVSGAAGSVLASGKTGTSTPRSVSVAGVAGSVIATGQ